MTHRDVPANVVQALETLERATSPADLGHHYQLLLDWRRQRPVSVFATNALMPIMVVVGLGAAQLFLSVVDVPVTDFWRGVQFGLLAASIFVAIQSTIFRRPETPQSLPRRIEAAIDRWRHAVPAMKAVPR
jgi:hypothetical protein